MNVIEAVLEKATVDDEEYLMLHIDGKPLDVMLSEVSPDDQLEGLVPTLGGMLEEENERHLVWQRFLPGNDTRIRAPVLMCPEHQNLFCTTIVAEVRAVGDRVEWRRVGIDDTPEEDLPELVGQDVFWLPDVGPFEFDRSAYLRLMNVFRQGSVQGGTLH